MALEFKLPDIGEGIAEGEIVKWLVAVGDSVEEHQPIVEVMTDKATVEIPAPQAGKIVELRAKEGEVVPVGHVLFVLGDGAAGMAAAAAQPAQPAKPEQRSPPRAEPKAAPRPEPKAPAKAEPKPAAPAAKPAPAKPAAAPSAGRTLDFKLPDIGEGIAEGEIVKWLVAAGDSVEEHQPIVEVMTDKATVEIPAPAAGTITELLARPGEVVPIGKVIFRLASTGAGAAPQAAAAPREKTEQQPAAAPERPAGARASAGNGKVLAVPSARRVARELGIELSAVPGSGRHGVIRRADVESFAKSAEAAPAAQAPAPAAPPRRPSAPVSVPSGERETRVPFRGVRRKIAEAMTRSKFTATHFTVVEELDVTELVALRNRAKEIGARDGIKVTYMPFIMKAVARGLFDYPELNSQLDESTQEIVTFRFVNLGIATDTPQGLIVPVIREVQSKGVLQLAAELQELAERTRAGKVRPEELQGGTFTITNAGNIGGTLATPIINFPEVGILGVHRIVKRPGVVETPDGDEIAVRHYMNLSTSVDHRLVDGASAARFLVRMKELLEDPALLVL